MQGNDTRLVAFVCTDLAAWLTPVIALLVNAMVVVTVHTNTLSSFQSFLLRVNLVNPASWAAAQATCYMAILLAMNSAGFQVAVVQHSSANSVKSR